MKFSGDAGFAIEVESNRPGVYKEDIVERRVRGDVLNAGYNYTTDASSTSDDTSIQNRLSIIMDAFLKEHLGDLRYITYMGVKWKISGFTINAPRIIINLGGIYNG